MFEYDKPRQEPAFHNTDLVRWSILDVEIGVPVFAMVETALHLLYVLMQGAAEGDIQLLKTAAEAEHRRTRRNRRLEQGQRRGIALLVEQYAFARRHAAIMLRRNIGGRTGEKKSVAGFQQVGGGQRRLKDRDQKRHRL